MNRRRHVLLASGLLLWSFQAHSATRAQVTDPAILAYASYFGGGGEDRGTRVAVDRFGAAYIIGTTTSPSNGGADTFVAKVLPSGAGLQYVFYIGGSGNDIGASIAVDSAGCAYVTGYTNSGAGFPVVGGLGPSYHGGINDVFVFKLNAAGTELLYSGFIGGAADDKEPAIALDDAGSAYITGFTTSPEATFPTGHGFGLLPGADRIFNGSGDAFVVKVRPDGSGLAYASYIGGSGEEIGYGIGVDAAGNAYVGGNTTSHENTFPDGNGIGGIPGADTTFNGAGHDAYVVKINAAGTAFSYATFIGGAGEDVYVPGFTVNRQGSAWVAGRTTSREDTFPTGQGFGAIPGFDRTFNGGEDAFVVKINTAGTAFAYATYIGGSGLEEGEDVAVDGAGNAYVTGYTSSTEATFPGGDGFGGIPGPDTTYNGGPHDIFVVKLDPSGTHLVYATYIGGPGPGQNGLYDELGSGIATDGSGNAYVGGYTTSTSGFPGGNGFGGIPGFDQSYNGGIADAFIVKISPGTPQSLAAAFTFSPAAPVRGQTVTFTDQSSGAPASWAWDFGDGGTSTKKNPGHAYSQSGTYPVSLTVSDGAHTSQTARSVTVATPAAPRSPVAAFSWTPASPAAGQPVQFTNASTGDAPAWAWDWNGDGITDSIAPNPVHAFAAAGPYRVSLSATNAYGSDRKEQAVTVGGGPAGAPAITTVQRELGGVFLQGTTAGNRFTAAVSWNGTPGTVRFAVNGGPAVIETGTAAGASHLFQIASDFPARFQASTVTLQATNGQGVQGPAWTETVFLVPRPDWLAEALSLGDGTLHFEVGADEVRAILGFDFPKPHLEGKVHIPSFVPYLAGDLGFEETFARVEGQVSSRGTGSLTVSGQAGFVALGQPPIHGHVRGSGDFRLLPPTGLDLTAASFVLGLDGTIEKEVGVLEAIPALATIADFPVLSWFNERATLNGQISPSLELQASFAQQSGALRFRDATGTLGLALKGTLEVDVIPRLTASGWVSGGGSTLVGVPAPFLRELHADVQAGVDLKLDWFFDIWEGRAVCSAACTWTNGGAVDCPHDCDADALAARVQSAPPVSPIAIDYERFGPLAELRNAPLPKKNRSIVPVALAESTVVANVFPGASPALVQTPDGLLLLWEQQDPALPVPQSTDIVWSLDDGGGWTAPLPVLHDTRAELDPVAGVAADGKVVAAWLRIKDPAFISPVTQISDLPLYLKQLEVVTGVFDPASRTWGPITQITGDAALDTDLQLAADGDGHLLLTWLSNPGGELLSTPASPSTLRAAFWNPATGAWGAPAAIAANLVGVASHTGAVHGSQAFVLVARDPDRATAGDGLLDLYTWSGAAWSAASTFAAGGVGGLGGLENRLPTAAYDAAGEGHAVWLRGDDLVHATLADPTPQPVRPGSASMAFYGGRFFTDPQGDLTLVWQEVADNEPADVFARVFDPASGSWSADRRLTAEPGVKHHGLAGFYGSDGVLRAAYLATQIERVSREVDLGGQTFTMTNIPVDGRTDLRVLEHSLAVDLAVTDGDLTLGAATATVTVHNAGDFAVGAFDVALWAGAPDDGGVLVAQARVSSLAAGAEVPVTIPFTAAGGDVVAVVDAGGEVTEITEANNTASARVANRAPAAVVLADVTSGPQPLTVHLDATPSFDPDGDPVSFAWSFADNGPGAAGATATVTHTFPAAGRYPVTLTVTDAKGAVGTAVVVITAGAVPPPDTGTDLYTVAPCRAVDTRVTGTLQSGVARTLQISGACGVPATAKAVSLNITVIAPTGPGRVTLYPGSATAPNTSTINFPAGVNLANNAILTLAANGAGTLGALATFGAGQGQVDVLIDVTGYFK